jgi:hypothetical protein
LLPPSQRGVYAAAVEAGTERNATSNAARASAPSPTATKA